MARQGERKNLLADQSAHDSDAESDDATNRLAREIQDQIEKGRAFRGAKAFDGAVLFKRLSSRPFSPADNCAASSRYRRCSTELLEARLETLRLQLNALHKAFPEIDPLYHAQTGRLRYLERTIRLIGAELDRREAEEMASFQDGDASGAGPPGSVGVPASVGAGTQSVASTRTARKRGPKPNCALALRIKGIVDRLAEGTDWFSKLDEVCEALDEEEIPVPKAWRNKRIVTWADSCTDQRDKTLKVIGYRLAQVTKGLQKS